MKASLKALLEKSIEDFLHKTGDHDDRPSGYEHLELAQRMSTAAEAVYDAAFQASVFTEQQVTP